MHPESLNSRHYFFKLPIYVFYRCTISLKGGHLYPPPPLVSHNLNFKP
jgi:hypothetical protein